MVAWSWRASCLKGIVNQSALVDRTGLCSLKPKVHNHHLFNQCTYSTWKRARQQVSKQHAGSYTSSTTRLNDLWRLSQHRSTHLLPNQGRYSQYNDSGDGRQEAIAPAEAEATQSRKDLSPNIHRQNGRPKRLSSCARISSLNSFQQRHHRILRVDRRINTRRGHRSRSSLIEWKSWRPNLSSGLTHPVLRYIPIDPWMQSIVGQGLSRWYPDADRICHVITREGSQSKANLSTELLAFGRYVHNNKVYQAWMKRSWRGKAVWWRHALYYAFLSSPSDALRIVADISKRTYLQIPGRIMSDALLILDGCYSVDDVYQQSEYPKIKLFHETVCTHLDNYTKREGGAFLSWGNIRRLSKVLQRDDLTRLVRSVIASKTKYGVLTKLHTMYRYLELDSLGDALDLFKTLSKEELQHEAVQKFCGSVLHKKWQTNNLHTLRQELSVWFLKQGAATNCQIRNIILQNYLEAGDRQSAFAMLESIRKDGQTTSEYTYSIFLNHTNSDDASTIHKLFEMATEDGLLMSSTFLAGHFVQVAATRMFDSGENSFAALLGLYETVFDTADLESFGILEAPGEPSRLNKQSSSFALQWMILSWIREHRNNPKKLISAYNNYQFHIRNNHPRIAMLACDPHTATAFVFAFGQHKSTLQMCTKVLQDMLQPEKPISPPGINDEEIEPDDSNVPDHEKFLEPEVPAYAKHTPLPFKTLAYNDWEIYESLKRDPFSYKVAPPAPATWNALLNVLLGHKQFDAAEGVLRAMQQAGFQANEMTWEILLRGFADRHVSLQKILEEMRINELGPDTGATKNLLSKEDGTQGAEVEGSASWNPDSLREEMASRL